MSTLERLTGYRALRDELEQNILTRATSLDGRRFTLQAPLDRSRFQTGGYVTIGDRLGQLDALEIRTIAAAELGWSDGTLPVRYVYGQGTVLDGDGAPFSDAPMDHATPERVAGWLRDVAPSRAALQVGELALAAGVACRLDAGGFGRHTFLCGQSGSGKTYSLGVLLEALLLGTSLRIVILDPNSDYVHLGEPGPSTPESVASDYRRATATLAVHGAGASGSERLRLRFPELSPDLRATALRLDPIADAEEYAQLAALLAEWNPEGLAELAELDAPLFRRVRNLGVDQWSIWAPVPALLRHAMTTYPGTMPRHPRLQSGEGGSPGAGDTPSPAGARRCPLSRSAPSPHERRGQHVMTD